MVYQYKYRHETSDPGTKEWRKWNNDNYGSKGKGSGHCSSRIEYDYREWETVVMEQWMIEYFQTTERPKQAGNLNGCRPDWIFRQDDMLQQINAVRTEKGWPEVHFAR